MDKIRVGIIGVGQIGKGHTKAHSANEDAEVVAIADINESEAKRVAQEHGIPHVYTDFRQLLERDDIKAVDVCLHNNLHAPVTIEALRAGKHVYCEKPMAGSYVDAKAMYDAAKECGKKLAIQLWSIFAKETKFAKHLIDNNRLGKIFHARSTGYRRRGRPYVDGHHTPQFVKKEVASGGALYDMGVYHIAQMLYLLGQPDVQRVSGKVYQETAMNEERRKSSGYNVEELGLGFVKFKQDITLDIIESWAIHLDRFEGSSIIGSEGGIRLNPFAYYSRLDDLDMEATLDIEREDSRRHGLNENEHGFDSSHHHWIAVLQEQVELMPSASLALQTMLISEGIYLSDKLGQEVGVDEILENSKSTALKV